MKKYNHGGNVYQYKEAQDKDLSIHDVYDYSANINPLGMSFSGLKALKNSIKDLIHYPDPEQKVVKQAISKKYSVDIENILLGNGVAEIIYAICHLEGYKGVLISAPTFSEYKEAAVANNYSVHEIYSKKEYNFSLTIDAFQGIDVDKFLIFLGHPNNPDGQLLRKDVLYYLLETNKNGLVIIDESFIDFVDPQMSYRDLIREYDNLIILHSFTKFYAIPGLRMGAAYMCKNLFSRVSEKIPIWSVNQLSQNYLTQALQDTQYYKESILVVTNERYRLYRELSLIQELSPILTKANFILIEWTSNCDFELFYQYLKKKSIFIRKCNTFTNLQGCYFRIAIKDEKSNTYLIRTIKEYFND